MYVIGFVGSPRHEGNSDILVDEMLRGCSELGAKTHKVYLGDQHIQPCQACEACKGTGVCNLHDDMTTLGAEMQKADAYVFATPVYFWGPSAQIKGFIDRCYSFYGLTKQSFMKGKPAAVICTFGDESPDTARNVVGMFDDILAWDEMPSMGNLLVRASGKGEVKEDREALNSAREIGLRIAQRLSGKAS